MEVAPRRPQSAVMTRHTFWFLSLLVLPLAQAAEASSTTVHLYDLAGVSNAILDPAVEIATRLYADAGVQLHWVRQTLPAGEPGQGPAFIPTATPTVVSLRLLPKHMSDRVVRPGSQKLGIAFPTGEGRFRYLASVFYDRVELAAAELTDLPLPVLLGHIMAHELGHLLLGPDAHARNTIMACPWDTTEFRFVKRGQFGFNKSQSGMLRSQLERRHKAADSTAAIQPRPASQVNDQSAADQKQAAMESRERPE